MQKNVATLRLSGLQFPDWRDLLATTVILGGLLLFGTGAYLMVKPINTIHPIISLSPAALPLYALRTTMRMFAALLLSLIFTLIYATLAAKSRRAEMILIPLLDVLQSVPVLGYLSFTVLFFLSIFPKNSLGPELAAIFAIFTSQAWNMTFSFYQSLKTIPTDLDEASRGFRFSNWQRFWNVEVPFAAPGLIWNMMMSMSGGWFFVVASEAISVGHTQVTLRGIGAYVALAIQERDLKAVGWAIVAMSITILLYDQFLFRPLVAWADKFRFEQTSAQAVPKSWVLELFLGSRWMRETAVPLLKFLLRVRQGRFASFPGLARIRPGKLPKRTTNVVWFGLILGGIGYGAIELIHFAERSLFLADVIIVMENGALTLLRVVFLIFLASIVWVPIGVAIGLHPSWAGKVQPMAQFLAAFPANLLFPLAIFFIVRFGLSPRIWLSLLMILGTQWYILFNVIAGASAFPSDFREMAAAFRIHGWHWWRDVMLPGIFPYYVTGAITASGGAWNASIISEVVNWGQTQINGGGLGAYIAQMTEAGDFPRIALGIAVMSSLVIMMNRLLWRPLYAFAERRTRFD